MTNYDPTSALLIFAVFAVILFLFFRPRTGWYWIITDNLRTSEKIIIEDILKQLYHNEISGNEQTVNALTNGLKFKNSLIIEVIEKMAMNDLVAIEGDVVKLKSKGRNYALRIVRVHRLWEKYLAEKTGFDKKEWHDRAEHKEHQMGSEEANILATQLGNPIYDPHGDPIPTAKGKIKNVKGQILSSLPVSTVGRIVHIEDEPDVIYRQILAEKIHIGSQIHVVENNKERIVFHSEGEEFVLAPIVASNITLSVSKKNKVFEENILRLSSLGKEETAHIIGISKESRGDSRRRLLDLGFVKGAEISIDLLSPLKNPTAYSIKGTSIALRKDQASKILIKKEI